MRKSASLSGKITIVTGSTHGIGKEIALAFLRAGAVVVINGRNTDSLKCAEKEFNDQGYKVLTVQGDVSSYNDCVNIVEACIARYGKIDILINNAGIGFRGAFDQTYPEVLKKVIDCNLMSAVFMTRACINEIKKNKGSIIFISSYSGLRGFPLNAPYCIAKMGLTALHQTLQIELSGTGVHIGIAMVGLTDYDEQKRVLTTDGTLIQIKRKSHHTRKQVAGIILQMVSEKKKVKILHTTRQSNSVYESIFPFVFKFIGVKLSMIYNK